MTKRRRSHEVSGERAYYHPPKQWFALSFITYLLISLGLLEHKYQVSCVNGSHGVSAVGKVILAMEQGSRQCIDTAALPYSDLSKFLFVFSCPSGTSPEIFTSCLHFHTSERCASAQIVVIIRALKYIYYPSGTAVV
jgi:hypothetical protein